MAVAVDAYPAARLDRAGPAPPGAPAPGAPLPTQRTRIISLYRPAITNSYSVLVSPRLAGPALIKDYTLSSPNKVTALDAGIKVFWDTSDGGGILDTASLPAPTGTALVEGFTNNVASALLTPHPFLVGLEQVHTAVGAVGRGIVRTLDFYVNATTFYLKVLYNIGNSETEGYIRVVEGVPPDFY